MKNKKDKKPKKTKKQIDSMYWPTKHKKRTPMQIAEDNERAKALLPPKGF